MDLLRKSFPPNSHSRSHSDSGPGRIGPSGSAPRVTAPPRALIAAKRVYFGVGGGVDEFLRVLGEMGGRGKVVWETGPESGVGRVILEVTAHSGQ